MPGQMYDTYPFLSPNWVRKWFSTPCFRVLIHENRQETLQNCSKCIFVLPTVLDVDSRASTCQTVAKPRWAAVGRAKTHFRKPPFLLKHLVLLYPEGFKHAKFWSPGYFWPVELEYEIIFDIKGVPFIIALFFAPSHPKVSRCIWLLILLTEL